MPGALAGLRVLDLAGRQGALCGRLLAELGADVVLVEPPGGHPLRALPPCWHGLPPAEASACFWFYEVGRRSIVVDRTTRGGSTLLDRLAGAADVLVDTGAPGTAAAFCARHPRLVVAAITPFGQAGPWRDWSTSDLVAQALGGMMAVSGHPDGPPLAALGLQAYHQAGIFAAIGALAALHGREATGRGQLVDVSIEAAVAGALEHVPGLWHQTGEIPRRQGGLHWTRYFRVGRCRDGWVLHCTLGDWTSLFEWVRADGMAASLEDAAWDNLAYRKRHAERLFDALDAWAARHTVAELHEGAQARRIPYAAVRAPAALLDDPQLAARGFFVPLDHPGLGRTLPFPGPPFRLRGWAPPRRPPALDEHGVAVRAEWLGHRPGAPASREER